MLCHNTLKIVYNSIPVNIWERFQIPHIDFIRQCAERVGNQILEML